MVEQQQFARIPGESVAYWLSSAFMKLFEGTKVSDLGETREGLSPADNDRFLRLWPEVESEKWNKKWFPYTKGGNYRKWYGNNDYMVNWENDGLEIKNNIDKATGRIRSHNYNGEYALKEGFTWTAISTSVTSFRYVEGGFLFDSAGSMGFAYSRENLKYIIANLNSKIAEEAFRFISPTIKFMPGQVASIPCNVDYGKRDEVTSIADELIAFSKSDWDSFETSWDFKKHPLLRNVSTISEAFAQWQAECDDRFNQLKANEEELNRIFIDIYGLQDELTTEVEDKDVTVRKADLQRDIKSLLSYAVGCMFGRYSLDKPGLIFAGGNFDSVYWKYKGQAALDENDSPIEGGYAGISLAEYHYPKFHDTDDWETATWLSYEPDVDNVIPITDEEYLDDDIVSRLCTWLKAVYGADTLEANLDYIAKALGNKGSTSREIIRNYFLNDFFKDHCQTYSVTGSGKRPIYWLFDSGKQNGFKALVYLHRYTPDTIGNLRIDYLHKMQRVYESEINRMQDMMDHSGNAREVAAASKRKDKLAKQLKECREYDEKISHLALSRIELDLDDGVKVNYRKLQTAQDGKFYEVLADSKNIMVKEKK